MKFVRVLLPSVAVLVGGCTAGSSGVEGDCTGFVEFADSTYDVHGRAISQVPDATRIGKGEFLDCDRRPIESVDVYRIDGVNKQIAIAVRDSSMPGVFLVWVLEGSKPSEWPPAIRARR